MSGRAVEAAGDVDVLLLDKTGTITLGDRQATAFIPAPGVTVEELADAAQLASLADETPEGRSIVVLAKKYGLRGRSIADMPGAVFIPFSAQTRMSGVDLDGRRIRKGAPDAIQAFVRADVPLPRPRRGQRHRPPRRDAAPRGRGRPGPGRHPSQGHRQGRPEGPFRAVPGHGHQDGHDHRRQPADRRGHRPRGRRRRFHRRGQAGGQAGPHPQGAGGRPPRGHDRATARTTPRPWPRPTSAWP